MNAKEELIQAVYQSRCGDLNGALTVVGNLRCDKCIHYVEEGHQCWCPDTTVSYAPADFFCALWKAKA
jgi:hypothetical protein